LTDFLLMTLSYTHLDEKVKEKEICFRRTPITTSKVVLRLWTEEAVSRYKIYLRIIFIKQSTVAHQGAGL
jgi:hypothetical protein